jgi:hypothetical protein
MIIAKNIPHYERRPRSNAFFAFIPTELDQTYAMMPALIFCPALQE